MLQIYKSFFYIASMLFFISIISFGAIHLAPNSFFASGELNPNMTQEAISQLKSVYGLDKPLYQQYFDWLFSMFSLNFGISFVSGEDVFDEISKRLPVTLFINIVSMFFIFVFSIYFGIKSALNYASKKDFLAKQFAVVSFSMPSFYLALLLMLSFSIELKLFPIAGLHSIDTKDGFVYYLDMLWHLFLPIFVIVFTGLGSMIVYVRSLTLDILKSDYYYFALSRGISKRDLLRLYILPNLLPPMITLLGLSLPGLIGGSVILESIFGIEGMGQLFYMSAMSRDYPVIMGILMITSFLTLVGNMLADLILLRLNPYIKYQ